MVPNLFNTMRLIINLTSQLRSMVYYKEGLRCTNVLMPRMRIFNAPIYIIEKYNEDGEPSLLQSSMWTIEAIVTIYKDNFIYKSKCLFEK